MHSNTPTRWGPHRLLPAAQETEWKHEIFSGSSVRKIDGISVGAIDGLAVNEVMVARATNVLATQAKMRTQQARAA